MKAYLDRVRSLLAGIEGEEWEARSESPSMDGGNYTFRREGKPGIIISAHMYGHGLGSARAAFIAEAPTAVTRMLAQIDAVEAVVARLDQEIVNSRIAERNAAEADMGTYLTAAQSETFAYKQARMWLRAAMAGEGE